MYTLINKVRDLLDTTTLIGLVGPTGTCKSHVLKFLYNQFKDYGDYKVMYTSSLSEDLIELVEEADTKCLIFVDNYCESPEFLTNYDRFKNELLNCGSHAVFATSYACTAHQLDGTVCIDLAHVKYDKTYLYFGNKLTSDDYILRAGTTCAADAKYYLDYILAPDLELTMAMLDIDSDIGKDAVYKALAVVMRNTVAISRSKKTILDTPTGDVATVLDIMYRGGVVKKVDVNDQVVMVPAYASLYTATRDYALMKKNVRLKLLFLGVILESAYGLICSFKDCDTHSELIVTDEQTELHITDVEVPSYLSNENVVSWDKFDVTAYLLELETRE